MLVGVRGKNANACVVKYAVEQSPSLIVDCANAADPIRLRLTNRVQLAQSRIIPAESLYRFRETLRVLPSLINQGELVAITAFHHLFGYDDEEENNNITLFSWQQLSALAMNTEVIVTVPEQFIRLSKKFCSRIVTEDAIMGHTTTSQRRAADTIIGELLLYGRSLRAEDAAIYERIVKDAFKHLGSISYVSSVDPWAFVLVSILFEQDKRIHSLENERLAHRCIQS